MRTGKMSYVRLSDDNQRRMNIDSLRWAIKSYSRVLGHPVWVVLKYPYDDRVETTYLTVKKELGLTKKPRGRKWRKSHGEENGKFGPMLSHPVMVVRCMTATLPR